MAASRTTSIITVAAPTLVRADYSWLITCQPHSADTERKLRIPKKSVVLLPVLMVLPSATVIMLMVMCMVMVITSDLGGHVRYSLSKNIVSFATVKYRHVHLQQDAFRHSHQRKRHPRRQSLHSIVAIVVVAVIVLTSTTVSVACFIIAIIINTSVVVIMSGIVVVSVVITIIVSSLRTHPVVIIVLPNICCVVCCCCSCFH